MNLTNVNNVLMHGQTAVGTGVVQVVSGLTISDFMNVKALSTNGGIVYLGRDNTVVATSGYQLLASADVLVDTGGNVTNLYAIASTNGNTISYLGRMKTVNS